MAKVPFTETHKILVDLARAHLVEAAPGGPMSVNRWRTHDLLRLYAQRLSDEHAEGDGRKHARERLLAYYLSYADAADHHLRALPGKAESNVFSNRDHVLTWLNYERASLVAAVTMAADTGQDQTALALADSLAEYLNGQRRFGDWLAVTTTRLDATLHDGNRHSYAIALNNRGLALYQVRELEEAITACREAAAIFRDIEDQPHLGGALNNLGAVLLEVREFEEAIIVCQEAADIFQGIGDLRGEGGALNSLGAALWQADQFQEAITANQRSVVIFREIGDRPGEGGALDNLGLALRAVGQLEEAISEHKRAVDISREIGDQSGQGRALNNLGLALREAGRLREAITAPNEDLAICLATQDRHGQGGALNSLGAALQDMGLFEEAITAFQNAASIFRETKDLRREGIALKYLEAARAAQRA